MRNVAIVLLLIVGLVGVAFAEDEEAPAKELKRGFADGKFVDEYFDIVYAAPELKEGFGFGLGGPTVLWSGKCAGGVDVELMCMESPTDMAAKEWMARLKQAWAQDGKERKEMTGGDEPQPWAIYIQESLAGFQRHHGYACYTRGPQCFLVHGQVREKSDTSADAIKAALAGLKVGPKTDSFLFAHLAAKQAGGAPDDPAMMLQGGMAYLQGNNPNHKRGLAALDLAKEKGAGTFDGDQAWTLEHGRGLCQLMLEQREEAIPTWKKAIELAEKTQDPSWSACNSHYNLACAYSLLGRLDEAFETLKKSFSSGTGEQVAQLKEHAQQDGDLENMRADAERWKALFE